MSKDILIRSDLKLKKLLNEIKLERIRKGKDKKMLSDRRLTLAIARIPRLKEVLENAELL